MTTTVVAVNDKGAREKLSAPAIRAFLRLAETWELSTAEQIDLLGGSVGRTTLGNWADGELPKVLSADQLMRISYLLGIYEGLQRVWRRAPAVADAWPRTRRYDPPFVGRRPLEVMREGGIPGLAVVRAYVDTLTGGPPSRADYPQPRASAAPRAAAVPLPVVERSEG